MTGVAIVGIGMHEFGRTDGVSGLDQGAIAVRRALADAGVGWEDMQFAVGGSAAAGAADSLVSRLGLTGLQFTNVSNGCATGGSALCTAANAIMAGTSDIGIAIGFDKHERGTFRVDMQAAGLGEWYGASGLALTTQFFGMKINRYMHEHGITQPDAREGGRKGLPQRGHEPNGVAPQADLGGGDPCVGHALVPPHAVHVLLAWRGWCGNRALPR